jgi:hypothetical protein
MSDVDGDPYQAWAERSLGLPLFSALRVQVLLELKEKWSITAFAQGEMFPVGPEREQFKTAVEVHDEYTQLSDANDHDGSFCAARVNLGYFKTEVTKQPLADVIAAYEFGQPLNETD